MKLRDAVRFSALRAAAENGPVTIYTPRLKTSVKQLLNVIDQKPGITYNEIASLIRFPQKASNQDKQIVAARLCTVVKNKNPSIKRMLADGIYRYYPANYRLTNDPIKNVPNIIEKVVPQIDIPQTSYDIEQLIKNYVWETNESSAPFKAFLTWYKKQ